MKLRTLLLLFLVSGTYIKITPYPARKRKNKIAQTAEVRQKIEQYIKYNNYSPSCSLVDFQYALKKDANLRQTVLLNAANKYYFIVEMALQCGADPNAYRGQNFTPLHQAAQGNKKDVVELLLKYNADINIQTADGNTVLHSLGHSNSLDDMFDFLLSKKPNANIQNKEGCTPLHVTALDGLSGRIKGLVKHGACPSIRDLRGQSARDLARILYPENLMYLPSSSTQP